jgi:hypothetical protein
MLKNELVYHDDYKTRFTVINEITQYVELYYIRSDQQSTALQRRKIRAMLVVGLELKKVWVISRQDKRGLTFTIRLRN